MDPIRFDPTTGMYTMPPLSGFLDVAAAVLACLLVAGLAHVTYLLICLCQRQRANLRGVRK